MLYVSSTARRGPAARAASSGSICVGICVAVYRPGWAWAYARQAFANATSASFPARPAVASAMRMVFSSAASSAIRPRRSSRPRTCTYRLASFTPSRRATADMVTCSSPTSSASSAPVERHPVRRQPGPRHARTTYLLESLIKT